MSPFQSHPNLDYGYSMRGSRGRGQESDHKNIGFLSNTGRIPELENYQASIHCWAIIGTLVRWRANHGPLLVVL